MKKISIEKLLVERPNLKETLALNNATIDLYISLYNMYSNLLIQYLSEKFYLKNFDQELKKKKEEFIPVLDDAKDLYQSQASGYLEYFYLRNNLYIERMTKEQLQYLNQLYRDNITVLNDDIKKFLEETYLNVMFETKEIINVLYGPDNANFLAPGNAIIIGVRYDEESKITMESQSNLAILTDFLKHKLNKEYPNINFEVIKYNSHSVKLTK